MKPIAAFAIRNEQRRFSRFPFQTSIQYRYGRNEAGLATCCNVGRGGLNLLMGRYLRPGTLLMLEAADPHSEAAPIELKAQVAWIEPAGREGAFLAGVRVLEDEAASSDTVNDLIYQAMSANGATAALLEERRKAPAPQPASASSIRIRDLVEFVLDLAYWAVELVLA